MNQYDTPISKSELAQLKREEKFRRLIEKYLKSSDFQQMDEYIQHGNTTTLEHCKNVAWISFLINERLGLNAEEKDLLAAAMLHDFYLYDWHDGEECRKTHGFDHPYIACDNAKEIFGISQQAQEAIKSHMWPLNILQIPKSKIAIMICLADKYCALIETIRRTKKLTYQ